MGKQERPKQEPSAAPKVPASGATGATGATRPPTGREPVRAEPAGPPVPPAQPPPPSEPLEEWQLSDRDKLDQAAEARKRANAEPPPPNPYRRVSWIGLERAGGEMAELDPQSVPWNPLELHALVGLVEEARAQGRTALLLDPPYLPAVERELIRIALERTAGKLSPAARLLGLNRLTLHRRRLAAAEAQAGTPRGMGGRRRVARATGGAPLDYDARAIGQALLLVSLEPPWLAEAERKLIALALRRCDGRQGAAAAFLGVSLVTLQRRLLRDATFERRAADGGRAAAPARAELLRLLGSKNERIRLQAARNLLGAERPAAKPKP